MAGIPADIDQGEHALDAGPSKTLPDAPWRTASLTRLLAVALLCGFLLSPRLWLSGRTFPLTPVSDLLPPVPPPVAALWFGAMLLLLLALVVFPRCRWLLLALLVLAGTSALWDQCRWQPWFYQYLAMFGALAWASWKPDSPQTQAAALDTCRLIVAATYVWSGIQKMNATFVLSVFPWLMQPLALDLPSALRPLVHGLGLVVPFVETGIGVGLLLRPTRRPAVAAAAALHLLLLFLGPAGHNWNSVVWPWNVAMIGMVVVLFRETPDLTPGAILWPRRFPYARVVLLFFGILPALHLVGLWDAYLSAALYSGNTLDAQVRVRPEQRELLPPEVLPALEERADWCELDLTRWSLRDLNVPAYPARRVYRHVAEELAARADPAAELTLVIQEQADWLSGARRETTYPCSPGK